MKKIWRNQETSEDIIKNANKISEKYHLSSLTSICIVKKGIKEKDIEKFLKPTRNDFYDPFLMPDMKKAVDRILKAIDNNEKILVYGDYDVDGITSSCIIKRFMKDRKIDVGVYIPNRISEGYGLNNEAIEKIAKDGYNLIITVDCGITSIDEVKLAKQLGVDVIITDHHETGEKIPEACAVIDCKREDNTYPFRELAGCGVAFKLIQALSKKLSLNEEEYLKYIDIVCIGTISDIVPLIDENRVIAKLGLLLVNQTKNLGIKELIKLAGLKDINSSTISFGISPRINACGRMGHQEEALELFLTDDPIKARALAEKLESYNKERQQVEKHIYEEALDLVEKEDTKKTCLVLGKNNWHHGVIGIVSSKITEQFYKPSILVCFEGELSKGSGRSIDGFDLYEAVSNCSNILETFGGHSMAIGLTLRTNRFEEFKKKLEEYAKKHIKEDSLIPEIVIDGEIKKQDLKLNIIKELDLLEPYGEANKRPIFIYKNLRIDSIRTLSEGKHIKLLLKDDNIYLDAVGFGMGKIAEEYQIGDKIDIVGNFEINCFNNLDKIQVLLKDIRKSIK